MPDPLKMSSTAALTKLMEETEATLSSLRAELKLREESAQHREIDRLEEHMANAQVSLKSIKEFFELVLKEIRGNK
jgi:hypothetical protein